MPLCLYMLYMQNDGCILIRPSVVHAAARYLALGGMLRYERVMVCQMHRHEEGDGLSSDFSPWINKSK